MAFATLLYETEGAVATITLNRPERLNTIVPPMPEEIEQAVAAANRDPEVRVRAEAIAALATSGDPALLERLERLAREDPNPQIRGQAAQIARIRESRLH